MSKQIIIGLFLVIPIFMSAQVVEKSMDMSDGEQSGLEVELPVDRKNAEKIWKSYVKPYGKVDWDRKNKEHVLFNVRVSSITSDQVTIVARFNQYKDITKGSFWIKSGDKYLTSSEDSDDLRSAGEFLQEYAYETERHSIREQIKGEDKSLSKLDKDLGKLVKKNDNLHKDIEKAKETIAKKEKEIEQNLKDQEAKKMAIEKQKETIQKTTLKLTSVGKS